MAPQLSSSAELAEFIKQLNCSSLSLDISFIWASSSSFLAELARAKEIEAFLVGLEKEVFLLELFELCLKLFWGMVGTFFGSFCRWTNYP